MTNADKRLFLIDKVGGANTWSERDQMLYEVIIP